jgi:hypothetical protein
VTTNVARLHPEPEPAPQPLFRLQDVAVGARLLYIGATHDGQPERWRVVAILHSDAHRWRRIAGIVAKNQADRVEMVDGRGYRLDRAAGTLAWTSCWMLLP